MNYQLKRLAPWFTLLTLSGAGMQSAVASPVSLDFFGPGAVSQTFASATETQVEVADGNLTVSGGVVSAPFEIQVVGLRGQSYYDGGDASILRFDFSTPVAALGMDFVANTADVTLSLFNSAGSLLESHTIAWATLPTTYGSPYGFIGINFGSNQVSYATIDTPLNGEELYIDNVVYQTQTSAVPEPSSWALLSVGGLAAFAARGRRRNRV